MESIDWLEGGGKRHAQHVWLGVWNVRSMITAYYGKQTKNKHTRTFFNTLESVSSPSEEAVASPEDFEPSNKEVEGAFVAFFEMKPGSRGSCAHDGHVRG